MIAGFLERHPRLEGAVEDVLARAAEVRARRDATFGQNEIPAPRPSAGFLRCRNALYAAVGQMENPDADESSVDAVRQCLADLKAESHAFSARRPITSEVDSRALIDALRRFRESYSGFEAMCREGCASRPPWQIEFASHCAPETPAAELEIVGHELPSSPVALRPWGERCFLSGTPFHVESRRAPQLRYRSLEACAHVVTPEYHSLIVRIRAAIGRLREPRSAACTALCRLFPLIEEDYVAETSTPGFAKLGLLDFPSLAVSLNNLLLAYAHRPLFGTRASSSGEYAWQSYGQVRLRSLRLAHGLERLGLQAGQKIGILSSENAPDFHAVDFAAILGGMVTVGLQDALTDTQLETIACRAELDAVVCDATSLRRVLASGFRKAVPGLGRVIVYGDATGSTAPGVVSLESLLTPLELIPETWRSASGIALKTGIIFGDRAGWDAAREASIPTDAADQLYTIIFTSGSTGPPKGTGVTRRRWAEEMCLDANLWPHVSVSFQPSAIAADRGSVWRGLYHGGRIGFARRGAALFEDVRAIRPTIFDVAPVIWNTLYCEYRRAISDPALTRPEAARIRREFKSYLGGRIAFMATGGAPSDPGVRATMAEIFDVPMREGYGTTETGVIAADGRLIAGLDYRLVDRPELGFTSTDEPHPRGELAVKTPNTVARYFNDATNTAEGFTEDGYFLTGDIVELLPDRGYRIVGRRKQFFKLAGSEFLSPEALEAQYLASELVENILVTALPVKSSVAAVVIASRPDVAAEDLRCEFRAIAATQKLRACDVPLAIVVESATDGAMPWSVENGLLTPSFKLNRRALEQRYRCAIEDAYAAIESAGATHARVAPDAAREGGMAAIGESLRAIVGAILARPASEIDIEASFNAHGGSSLSGMEFAVRLGQVFSGKETASRAWLEDPGALVEMPLRELAERIGRHGPAPASAAPATASPSGPAAATAGPPENPAPRPPVVPAAPVARTSGNEHLAAMMQSDYEALRLPESFPPASASPNVLITGATGFLGSHLAAHLAAALPAGAQVFTIVRATSDAEACERVRRALREASLPLPSIGIPADGNTARVVAMAGSLERPELGLSHENYLRLRDDTGLIYHVAATVGAALSYQQLRAANVAGTRQVLDLACSGTTKAFHFVSSLNVSLLIRQCGTRRVLEESPLPGSLPPLVLRHSPAYALTKWTGERMVERLLRHGNGAFRASVSRPSLITWSQRTGIANAGDWLTRVLSSCLLTGFAIGRNEAGVPNWVAETETSARGIDMVPVDFAAHAVAVLGRMTADASLPASPHATAGRVPTFHVSNRAPGAAGLVTLPHLMDRIVASAERLHPGRMAFLPLADWKLEAEIASAPALPLLEKLEHSNPTTERLQARWFEAAMTGDPVYPGGAAPFNQAAASAFVQRVLDGLPSR